MQLYPSHLVKLVCSTCMEFGVRDKPYTVASALPNSFTFKSFSSHSYCHLNRSIPYCRKKYNSVEKLMMCAGPTSQLSVREGWHVFINDSWSKYAHANGHGVKQINTQWTYACFTCSNNCHGLQAYWICYGSVWNCWGQKNTWQLWISLQLLCNNHCQVNSLPVFVVPRAHHVGYLRGNVLHCIHEVIAILHVVHDTHSDWCYVLNVYNEQSSELTSNRS